STQSPATQSPCSHSLVRIMLIGAASARFSRRTVLVAPTRPPPRSTLFPYTTLFRSRSNPLVRQESDELHDRRRRRQDLRAPPDQDRKSTRLNSSHGSISYAVFCLKKKKIHQALHLIHF